MQLAAPRQPRVVDLDIPAPGPGQVLVKVRACGVCGSDMNAWQGVPGVEYPLPPGAPGHEAWGEVAALGPDAQGFELGDHVTGLIQGGYAQYAPANADELLAMAGSLASRPLLGEPLACAANVVRRACVAPGDRVAVVGFGYLAALIVQLLFPRGDGEWVAISRRAESRRLALELGAGAAFDFPDVPGDQWDNYPVVIEAAGAQAALDYATWLTAYGGRLVIAGYHADGPRTVNMQSWNWKGIDVINAHERQPAKYLQGLRDGLDVVQRHGLDPWRLVSHQWPLEQAGEAFTTAEQRPASYVKGVLMPWGRL